MTDKFKDEISAKYPLDILCDLVDDDEHIIKKTEAILDQMGIKHRKFLTAASYKIKLDELPSITPQLALLDFKYEGEGLTGYDLLLMLMARAKKKAHRTKCIMITGYDHPKTIRNFFRKGGYDWINKYESDFEEQLVEAVSNAVADYEEMLEDLALYETWKTSVSEQDEEDLDAEPNENELIKGDGA